MKPASRHIRQSGFALVALMFMATALTILVAASVPLYQMQARREMEAELIFRGEEYVRAIQKFQRRFGAYPPTIEALLETNGVRFLRKEYKDPVTGEAMRLISINPDGSINGSVVMGLATDEPLFRTDPQAFEQGGLAPSPRQTSPGQTSAGRGQSPNPFQLGGTGRGGRGAGGPAGQSRSGLSPGGFLSPSPRPGAVGNIQPSDVGGLGSTFTFNAAGDGVPVGGSGIIGVASSSEETSIRVYNEREKYNEWEFIALLQPPGMNNPGDGANPPPNPGGGPGAEGGGGNRPPFPSQNIPSFPGMPSPGNSGFSPSPGTITGFGGNAFPGPQSPFGGDPQGPPQGQPPQRAPLGPPQGQR